MEINLVNGNNELDIISSSSTSAVKNKITIRNSGYSKLFEIEINSDGSVLKLIKYKTNEAIDFILKG